MFDMDPVQSLCVTGSAVNCENGSIKGVYGYEKRGNIQRTDSRGKVGMRVGRCDRRDHGFSGAEDTDRHMPHTGYVLFVVFVCGIDGCSNDRCR